MHKKHNGFALLVAVIFMSVMLAFGLALGSLGFKQTTLASDALGSQTAFYVADAGLECALYADQQEASFLWPSADPGSVPASTDFSCEGANQHADAYTWSNNPRKTWTLSYQFSMDSGTHCVSVMVRKWPDGYTPTGWTHAIHTDLLSQGYDAPCSQVLPTNTRVSARGIESRY